MSQPSRTTTASGDGYQPDPNRWRALSVCLIAGFMTLLDVSIVNVALPSIRSSLHATSSDLQWVLAGYSLAFGLALVPAGRLGDARGRKRVFITALGLFTLTSVGAGLAMSATWLVVARLAQGVAAGVLNPQTSGIIQDQFRGAERGRAFGMLGATIGISTAVGPLSGGLILAVAGEQSGWRGVFLVNVPVGVAGMLLAARLLPTDRRPSRRESLDPVGTVLLGAGVFMVLLPLVEERQWSGNLKWVLIAAALVVLAGFVRWEARHLARGRAPLINPELYRRPSFTVGSTLAAVYFAGFTSLFFILTLFLQIGEGYSPLLAGLTATPFALGSALAAHLGGRAVARAGRRLVVAGLVLVIVGLSATDVTVGLVQGRGVGWALVAPLLVGGLGSGLVIAPNRTLTLSDVPVSEGGVAAGVLQVGQRIGSSVGIAGVGAVFFHVLAGQRQWADALRSGLWVAVGFLVLALALAVLDLRTREGEPRSVS